MVDVVKRDPTKTGRAMDSLIMRAGADGYSPVHFHLGFFNARDLLDVYWPRWREELEGLWPQVAEDKRRYRHIPFNVFTLDDEIRLCCRRGGGPIVTYSWRPE